MRHPKVTLDEVGCCAMTHAFLRHPTHVRAWSEATGQLHVLYEIFSGTVRLSFVPNEETASVYCAFAKAEIKRLGGDERERLLCRHGRESHITALRQLIADLPQHRSH